MNCDAYQSALCSMSDTRENQRRRKSPKDVKVRWGVSIKPFKKTGTDLQILAKIFKSLKIVPFDIWKINFLNGNKQLLKKLRFFNLKLWSFEEVVSWPYQNECILQNCE